MKDKYIFFTFNDFKKDGGGVIRMNAILNALAGLEQDVILISNTKMYHRFHKNIKHIYLGMEMKKIEKKILQFMIAILPYFIVKLFFHKYINQFKNFNIQGREVFFFEYLDNTFGYLLYQEKLIMEYSIDIHGLAFLEFKHKNFKGLKKLFSNFKAFIARKHDQKVYKSASKIIAVSEQMKAFISQFYKIPEERICVLRDGINESLCRQKIDKELLKELRLKYKNDTVKIIMFIGNFKDLGGVDDLTKAFIEALKINKNMRLLLLGDGENYEIVKELIIKYNLQNYIFLLGRIEYSFLRTYQELADIIVCPDKDHPYSHMLPHIKYFDSLVANKVVINGDFSAVREFNKKEKVSLSFIPSNKKSLMDKILYAMSNYSHLKERYKFTKSKVCNDFTYKAFVKQFLENCKDQ